MWLTLKIILNKNKIRESVLSDFKMYKSYHQVSLYGHEHMHVSHMKLSGVQN